MRPVTKPREMITEPHEREAMRQAGRLVALAHKAVRQAIQPGINTRDLDALAEAAIRSGGGVPAFKGYGGSPRRPGFPATVCASPNEVVVHGLPNRRKLNAGDIISIDIGAIVDGHYGDSAWTYPVGAVSAEAERLLVATEQALWAAIAAARAGRTLEQISGAIEDVATAGGFGLVRAYCGHGIGRILHGWPQIVNYRQGEPGPTLMAGQAIAIEPMFNLGGDAVAAKRDGWTVVTADGAYSAHYEHTMIITDGAAEVTTARIG